MSDWVADKENLAADTEVASGCLVRAVAAIMGITEAVCLIVIFGIDVLTLRTNGIIFTEAIEHTRWKTWIATAVLGLLVASVGSLYFFFYAKILRRLRPLVIQSVALAVTIGLVIYFYSTIPVPPGTFNPGIPGP